MFDEKQLLNHFDEDMEMVQDLVEIFSESYPESIQALKEALEASNYKDIELHAHTVKGMIGNFFANELKEIAYKLEQMGRDEVLNDDTKAQFSLLSEGLPRLEQALKDFCE